MRSSRNTFLLFLCALAIVSLACLSTTEPFVTYPADTQTPAPAFATMPADAALAADPIPTVIVIIKRECAAVVADDALHLRVDPDPESLILAFMESGEVVQVISTSHDDWWLIKRGNQLGYAHSKYLKRIDCR